MAKAQNIDKFGYCIMCGKYLLKNIIINGKQEAAFDSDKDEVWLKLNTGSMMSISVCKPCKEYIDFSDPDTKTSVLEAVNNGWTIEMDIMTLNPDKYPNFTPEKRQELEDLYSTFNDYQHTPNFKA
jgi:hypothetical protein